MYDDSSSSHLVYSTEQGSICSGCARVLDNCLCQDNKRKLIPRTDGLIRLRYEVKSRKGKGVTLLTGLPLNEVALLDLARRLKRSFGTGGSVKDHVIELQGDHRQQVAEELRKIGYLVK